MPKHLDEEWLIGQAATETDRETVRNILKLRDESIKENKFDTGSGLFTVAMGGNLLSIRSCAAPSTIEVYYEIFRENSHFSHEAFSTSEAEFVLDIGANEGLFALRLSASNPFARILCVEPNPLAFEILSRNVRNNRLNNVVLIEKAVSSDGRRVDMEFVRQIHSIGGAKLRLVERPWLKEGFIDKMTVDSVTIVEILLQHSFPRIDLLKIDVEGMEDEIVGSISPIAGKIRKIVVERHSKDIRNVVVNELLRLGFDLVYEEDPAFARYYGDLYFINNAVEPCQ